MAAGDRDVVAHDAHALVVAEPVPLALLPHWIDDQETVVGRARRERLRLVRVDGLLRHREVRVGDLAPAHQPALIEDDVQLVDRVEVWRGGAHQQVAVAAQADQAVRAQVVVLREVVARGGELALVLRALERVAPAPRGIDLDERVLDERALRHRS